MGMISRKIKKPPQEERLFDSGQGKPFSEKLTDTLNGATHGFCNSWLGFLSVNHAGNGVL